MKTRFLLLPVFAALLVVSCIELSPGSETDKSVATSATSLKRDNPLPQDSTELDQRQVFSPEKEIVQPCSTDIIEVLKDPILQRSFFHIRDSILNLQFPDSTIKWTENTDLQPWMLNEFLDEVDVLEFERTAKYSLSMDLGLAPDGFQDSSTCKDEITLIHNRPGCRYSLWLNTSFFVEEHGCTEHTVVYFFTLNSAGIKNFRRDEAG